MSGELPGTDDQKLGFGELDISCSRTRSTRTSGGGSAITDEEEEMIIMTPAQNGNVGNKPKLKLFKQHELDSLAEKSLSLEYKNASDADNLSVMPNISVTSPMPKRNSPSEPISTMCSTMKRQIISR